MSAGSQPSPPSSEPPATGPGWAPRPALIGLGLVATALMLAGAILFADPMGRVLFGIATVALAAVSAHGWLVRPRLAVDNDAIRIRTLRGSVRLGWAETRTRLHTTRRLGRDVTTLEIESGDHLYVFGWLELGTDPRDVLDVLHAYSSR